MRSKAKSGLFLVLSALLVWLGTILVAETKIKILATVDGEIITTRDIEKKLQPYLTQAKEYEQTLSDDYIKEAKKLLLEQLIDEKLVLKEAKRQNFYVTKKEIDDNLQLVKGRFGTEDVFQRELKKQALSLEEYRKEIANTLLEKKVVDKEVTSKIRIPTDKEVEKFYEENKKDLKTPEQVRVRHILVRIEKGKEAEALKKIKRIENELKKGENFAALAQKYSEDIATKQRGGDLGFFARGELTPEFEKASFILNVGEVSDPVKTAFGWHLIKCIEKKTAELRTLAEMKEELRNYIFTTRIGEEYKKWISKLREEASIKKNLD